MDAVFTCTLVRFTANWQGLLLFLTLSSGVSTMCHLVPLYVYG